MEMERIMGKINASDTITADNLIPLGAKVSLYQIISLLLTYPKLNPLPPLYKLGVQPIRTSNNIKKVIIIFFIRTLISS